MNKILTAIAIFFIFITACKTSVQSSSMPAVQPQSQVTEISTTPTDVLTQEELVDVEQLTEEVSTEDVDTEELESSLNELEQLEIT